MGSSWIPSEIKTSGIRLRKQKMKLFKINDNGKCALRSLLVNKIYLVGTNNTKNDLA